MSIKKILKLIIRLFLSVHFKFFVESKCVRKYKRKFGCKPNLTNPKTFNEKILHKMLFDRNPKLTLFADKFLVRDFVKSRLGGDAYLSKLYGVVDSPDKIHDLNLPSQFVMKPNHLSGKVKIVRDKKSIMPSELEKLAASWLTRDHYYAHHEWAYKNIKPRIIFEEFLEVNGKIPDNWKFFCFHGEPRFFYIARKNSSSKLLMNYYDLNLSLLPVKRYKTENFQENIVTPLNFEKMLEILRKLSAGVDFIRVDLYNINGRIVFGELTNYPTAGLGRLDPPYWDEKFGSYWK